MGRGDSSGEKTSSRISRSCPRHDRPESNPGSGVRAVRTAHSAEASGVGGDESRTRAKVSNQPAHGDELAARGMPVCGRAKARAWLAGASALRASGDTGEVWEATAVAAIQSGLSAPSRNHAARTGIEARSQVDREGTAAGRLAPALAVSPPAVSFWREWWQSGFSRGDRKTGVSLYASKTPRSRMDKGTAGDGDAFRNDASRLHPLSAVVTPAQRKYFRRAGLILTEFCRTVAKCRRSVRVPAEIHCRILA